MNPLKTGLHGIRSSVDDPRTHNSPTGNPKESTLTKHPWKAVLILRTMMLQVPRFGFLSCFMSHQTVVD